MTEFELVLPCYNEAKSLVAMVEKAITAATAAGQSIGSFRLVLVDNGSTDNSRAVMEQLLAGPSAAWIKIVRVEVNQGYGYGLARGLAATEAPVVGWTHADEQCHPADAFRALAGVRESSIPTLVKGTRRKRNARDRFVSFVFACFARVILGIRYDEINAQPKIFPRELLNEITEPPKTFAFDLYVLFRALRAGYAVREITVDFPPRIHGVSKWAATFFGRYRTIGGMIAYMFRLRKREGVV